MIKNRIVGTTNHTIIRDLVPLFIDSTRPCCSESVIMDITRLDIERERVLLLCPNPLNTMYVSGTERVIIEADKGAQGESLTGIHYRKVNCSTEPENIKNRIIYSLQEQFLAGHWLKSKGCEVKIVPDFRFATELNNLIGKNEISDFLIGFYDPDFYFEAYPIASDEEFVNWAIESRDLKYKDLVLKWIKN